MAKKNDRSGAWAMFNVLSAIAAGTLLGFSLGRWSGITGKPWYQIFLSSDTGEVT